MQVRRSPGWSRRGSSAAAGTAPADRSGCPGNSARTWACWAPMITASRSWIGRRQPTLPTLGMSCTSTGWPGVHRRRRGVRRSRGSQRQRAHLVGAPTDPASSSTAAVTVGPSRLSSRSQVVGDEQLARSRPPAARGRPRRRVRRVAGPLDRRITTSSPSPDERAAGVGQAHLPAVPQEPGEIVDGCGPASPRTTHRPAQVRPAGRGTQRCPGAKSGRARSAVGASAEVLRQQPDGADHGPHRAAGQADQRVSRPHLRRVFQPRLGDRPAGRAAVRWCCR